uniref:Uncharacterized protein n=1 Tax=Anopheles culicifacies TaxID=139723 RepID=A0A182MFU2_9DIPT
MNELHSFDGSVLVGVISSSGFRFGGKLIGAAIGVSPVPPSIRLSKLNSPLEGVEIPTGPPASLRTVNGYWAADFTSKLSGRAGRPPLPAIADDLLPASPTPARGAKALLVGVGVSRLSLCTFESFNLQSKE